MWLTGSMVSFLSHFPLDFALLSPSLCHLFLVSFSLSLTACLSFYLSMCVCVCVSIKGSKASYMDLLNYWWR